MKTYFEYRRKALYVTLSGICSKDSVKKFKKKLYYVINEYNINNIVVNLKMVENKESIYDLLDEYDIKYGGDLVVID
ncbi:MAG: hypothetical protein MR265_01900 [Erysipelotrichaceae bacterium]|nr:hypothetical protein [Erysipelotrichaceae bacterium]